MLHFYWGVDTKLKINPLLKKFQNYRNKWLQHFRQMDRHRLPHLIMKYQPCGKGSQKTLQKISMLLMGPKEVTRPETLQAIFWLWLWWWWWCVATSIIWPREFLLWNRNLAWKSIFQFTLSHPNLLSLCLKLPLNLNPRDPYVYTFLIQQF